MLGKTTETVRITKRLRIAHEHQRAQRHTHETPGLPAAFVVKALPGRKEGI